MARFIAMLNQRSGEVQKEESKSLRKEAKQRSQKLERLLKEEVKVGMEIRVVDSGLKGQILEKRGEKYLVALGGNMTSLMEREKFVRAAADLGDRTKRKQRKKNFIKKAEKKQVENSPQIKPSSQTPKKSRNQDAKSQSGTKRASSEKDKGKS